MNNQRVSQTWLEYRIKLFKEYTYQSVLNQTNQNFEWLVLINKDWQRALFDKLFRCRIVLVESNLRSLESWKKTVQKLIVSEVKYPWIITSRIDSDDCYNRLYVDSVQQKFREREEVINYEYGHNIDIRTGKIMLRRLVRPNMFLSVIELSSNFKTCYIEEHGHIDKCFSLRTYDDSSAPMWLMVCHEHNISNAAEGVLIEGETLESLGYR